MVSKILLIIRFQPKWPEAISVLSPNNEPVLYLTSSPYGYTLASTLR